MRKLRLAFALAAALTPGAALAADPPPAPPAEELPPTPAAPKRTIGSLRELSQTLQAQSVDLRIAQEEVARLRGNERVALAALLPTLTGTLTGTVHLIQRDVTTIDQDTGTLINTQSPASPIISGVISLRQPLVNARNWYAWGTSKTYVEAAELRVDDKKRTVLAQAADALAAVIAGEKTAELNRIALKAALDRAVLIKKRTTLGAGKPIDAVRIEQDVLLARQAVVTGDEQLRKSREALGLVLGLGEPVGVGAGVSLDAVERSLRATCKAADVADRPDIKAAKKDLEVSQRLVTDIHLAFVPTLDFVTSLTLSNPTIFNPSPNTWTMQGVLTIPFWDGGARYGQMRAAQAVREQGKLRLLAAELQANLETTQAQRATGVADAAKDIAVKVRDLTKQERTLAEKAYELGDGSSLDVVEATRRERAAEVDVAVKELETVRARIASFLATAICPR